MVASKTAGQAIVEQKIGHQLFVGRQGGGGRGRSTQAAGYLADVHGVSGGGEVKEVKGEEKAREERGNWKASERRIRVRRGREEKESEKRETRERQERRRAAGEKYAMSRKESVARVISEAENHVKCNKVRLFTVLVEMEEQ